MIFRTKEKFPIHLWSNRLLGETAFIIGNGPSLLENDLTLLNKLFTIGINRSFRVTLPKILMWQDLSLYEDCYEDIVKLPCCKLTLKEIDKEDCFTHFSISSGSYSFDNSSSLLRGRGCTSALAIQLAVSLGCSSVVLLGCDCGYKDGQTDFYGKNKNHTNLTLSNFINAMDWVKRECPVPVFNCGNAPFWPKCSLEDAIRESSAKERHHLEWMSLLL